MISPDSERKLHDILLIFWFTIFHSLFHVSVSRHNHILILIILFIYITFRHFVGKQIFHICTPNLAGCNKLSDGGNSQVLIFTSSLNPTITDIRITGAEGEEYMRLNNRHQKQLRESQRNQYRTYPCNNHNFLFKINSTFSTPFLSFIIYY